MSHLLAALAFLASAPAPEPPPPDPTQPALVAKGKGYLIHAVPSTLPVAGPNKEKMLRGFQWGFDGLPGSRAGIGLLHTTTTTGDMKYLLVGGHTSYPGPTMNVNRVYHNVFRIAGAAADADRLYVVWYHEEKEEMEGIVKPAYDGKGKYCLVVFRLVNGEMLHDLEMKEGDFPKGLPDETSDAGPLKLTSNGASCYGVTFEFEGAGLVKQRYDAKRP